MSPAPVTPADVQVPADLDAPIVVNFGVHALRMAFVSRDGVLNLSQPGWSCPGIYVLMGPLGGHEKQQIYVGKARELRSRLNNHRLRPPISWWRTIAVARDTTDGFNTAETGYLEGRLAGELDSLPRIDLCADRLDIDTSLPQHLLLQLDSFVPTILAALRLAGLDLHEEATASRRTKHRSNAKQTIPGTIGDLLAAGLLGAGTRLTFDRAGRHAEAVVTTEGDLLVDGRAYSSPSMAAKKALGLKAANGWVSWRLEGGKGATLAALRAQLPTSERQ